MKKFLLFSILLVLIGCFAFFLLKPKPKLDTEEIITIYPQKPNRDYGYDCLNKIQRELYDLLESGSIPIGETKKIDENMYTTKEIEQVVALYNKNNYDEDFWGNYYAANITDGITLENEKEVYKKEFSILRPLPYLHTLEDIQKMQKEVDQVVDKIIASIPKDASDYAKAKMIADYLANTVNYDHWQMDVQDKHVTNEELDMPIHKYNSTVYGALVVHSAVCSGFSAAFKYIADKVGLYTIYVTDDFRQGGLNHAWNMVYLDDTWYHLDATFYQVLHKLISTDTERELDRIVLQQYIDGIPLPKVPTTYEY